MHRIIHPKVVPKFVNNVFQVALDETDMRCFTINWIMDGVWEHSLINRFMCHKQKKTIVIIILLVAKL